MVRASLSDAMSNKRLSGKVAIVTGGGSGIGRATCQLFAREGACVAVLDINGKTAQETADSLQQGSDNRNHCAIEADVTKVKDVKRAFQIAEQKLGKKCDVLVNNAGLGTKPAHLGDMEEKDFDFVINVNLKGVYLMSKEFINSLAGLDKEVRGTIVNMSSLAGKTGYAMRANYASSKAGVIGLTKTIALEFPTHRIRCNALLPGITATEVVKKVCARLREQFMDRIPLQRFAEPDEIANACLFLASDESSYVHGASLEVGGGIAA